MSWVGFKIRGFRDIVERVTAYRDWAYNNIGEYGLEWYTNTDALEGTYIYFMHESDATTFRLKFGVEP